MMLFAVQSLKSLRNAILIWRPIHAPMCDIFLMHELETLIQSLSELIDEDERDIEKFTSQTCVKNATNSPKVWKRGLLKERKNGITISFWRVLGISMTLSKGTQWLRGSRATSEEENICIILSSWDPSSGKILLSMTCLPSSFRVASIAARN